MIGASMSDAQRDELKQLGKTGTASAVIAIIISVLIQFGIVGPEREASRIAIENRITKLEAIDSQIVSLERLIDVRLSGIEREVGTLRRELRETKGSAFDAQAQ